MWSLEFKMCVQLNQSWLIDPRIKKSSWRRHINYSGSWGTNSLWRMPNMFRSHGKKLVLLRWCWKCVQDEPHFANVSRRVHCSSRRSFIVRWNEYLNLQTHEFLNFINNPLLRSPNSKQSWFAAKRCFGGFGAYQHIIKLDAWKGKRWDNKSLLHENWEFIYEFIEIEKIKNFPSRM